MGIGIKYSQLFQIADLEFKQNNLDLQIKYEKMKVIRIY